MIKQTKLHLNDAFRWISKWLANNQTNIIKMNHSNGLFGWIIWMQIPNDQTNMALLFLTFNLSSLTEKVSLFLPPLTLPLLFTSSLLGFQFIFGYDVVTWFTFRVYHQSHVSSSMQVFVFLRFVNFVIVQLSSLKWFGVIVSANFRIFGITVSNHWPTWSILFI